MDLNTVKKHIRVDHDFEDDLIQQYMNWAEDEVKDSVSTSLSRNEAYFEGNKHYEKAVALLTSHYFHNRLPMVEANRVSNNLPYGVMSAIHKLRGDYHEIE